MCQQVAVIYAGEVVEFGTVEEIFEKPSPSLYEGTVRLTDRSGTGCGTSESDSGIDAGPDGASDGLQIRSPVPEL